MISAAIEINAPPRVVREVLLDFPNLPNWHDKSFFLSITVASPADKTTGYDLRKGDKVQVAFVGASFAGTIVDNEAHLFSWLGSIPYIFSGKHHFRFAPVEGDANKTLFTQDEAFTGLLAFTMSFFSAKTLTGWKTVNEDLKVAAEAKWAKEQAA